LGRPSQELRCLLGIDVPMLVINDGRARSWMGSGVVPLRLKIEAGHETESLTSSSPPGAGGGDDKDDYDPLRSPKHLERLIRLGENRNFDSDRSKAVCKRVAPDTRARHLSAVRR
jgi:hypothetical protein